MSEPTLDTLVTDADLASLFGMTTRWVRDRVTDGTIVRTGRNRYQLGDSLQALIAYQTGGDVGEEINKARLRKLNADASRAELELAEAKKLVAPISEFESVWTERCAIIRANVMNVPRRVVTQLIGETDETRFTTALRAELVAALTAARDTNLSMDTKEHNEESAHQ